MGNAIVSKPRKAGLVAIMTAEIPISDGQSVFVFFHAPDDDPLKIEADDTLIAFKFALNKRDITHVVSPRAGRDISLKQTTQAISNVVEANSEKFQANRSIAKASKEELEALQVSIDDATTNVDALIIQTEQADLVIPTIKENEVKIDKNLKDSNLYKFTKTKNFR